MQSKSSSRSKKPAVARSNHGNPYVLSFDCERYHQGQRHYWVISTAQNPDELVAWGHAPTRELAERGAGHELDRLLARLARGKAVVHATRLERSR